MKEVISFRADNVTLAQIEDIKKYIKERYYFTPTMAEVIRSAVEKMHNDIISEKLYYESNKSDT